MAEDSVGKQVMDSISAPARKISDFVDRITGHASTAPGSANTSNSVHMNWKPEPSAEQKADIARRAKSTSDPSYADHQAPRKKRLSRKYGSGK